MSNYREEIIKEQKFWQATDSRGNLLSPMWKRRPASRLLVRAYAATLVGGLLFSGFLAQKWVRGKHMA